MLRVYQGLFRPYVGLSVRLSSSRIDPKGILANRVAVVTGSTDGIGFAIARRLAEDGAHVVVSSRKQQNVDRAVATLQGEGLSVVGTVCHVGKAEDRKRLVATELGAYNVSKTAVLGLTRSLALELAPKDIRVNCLVPGLIKTDFSRMLHENETFWNSLKQIQKLQRQAGCGASVVWVWLGRCSCVYLKSRPLPVSLPFLWLESGPQTALEAAGSSAEPPWSPCGTTPTAAAEPGLRSQMLCVLSSFHPG
ncbi:dehydrogenase/reductase SDR family member 2, mitochondrial isoform X1 [Manis javanica]|uniref:dehydrogenase/reductase SDR family member 2, mitochondrial isoform X1 n=1 Tax=Manis javanica TaxID=9974 RepID=UPI003C6CE7A7